MLDAGCVGGAGVLGTKPLYSFYQAVPIQTLAASGCYRVLLAAFVHDHRHKGSA